MRLYCLKFLIGFVFLGVFVLANPVAHALPPCPDCTILCNTTDCTEAQTEIREDHEDGREAIIDFIGESHDSDGRGGSGQFEKYEDWFWEFAKDNIIRAMMMMTEQLSAMGMQQVFSFGTIMDAKNQLETQRDIQVLQTQAHRDYLASDDFCWFGTNVRSLSHADQKANLNVQGLAARQISRQLGSASAISRGTAGATSRTEDRIARWNLFKSAYCDPRDNAFISAGTGLSEICGAGGDRVNNDIDFTRMVELPKTIEIDFSQSANAANENDIDIMSLASNLYGHNVLTRNIDENFFDNRSTQALYLRLRAIAAKRSVAQHSFNSIVGMKSNSDAAAFDTAQYLGALMKELGVPDNEIFEMIGENPSYYAQLEILAKRIYQNPDFYAYLYDTPANVKRKSTALKAIEVMLDRALFESQIRREMNLSVALSTQLDRSFSAINANAGRQ